MKKSLRLSLLCTAVLAASAQAENAGYIGAGYQHIKGDNTGSDSVSSETTEGGTISGAMAFGLGENGSFITDATIGFGGYKDGGGEDSHLFDGDEMDWNYIVGLHYVHDFGGIKAGPFFAYAEADNQVGSDEDYRADLVGLEAIFPVSDTVVVYAQYGQSSAHNSASSSGGIDDGALGRIGLAYDGFESTTLKLEYEEADAEDYEDDGEDGDFKRYSLSGETVFGGGSLAFTYGVSMTDIDAKDDSDEIEEDILEVGVRYYLGGSSPSSTLRAGIIGTPTLSHRAQTLTSALD